MILFIPFVAFLIRNLGAQYASMLHPLKNAKLYHEGKKTWEEAKVGAEAIDNFTLKITLEHPIPYFLELLNHYSWFPVHRPTLEKFDAFEKMGTPWTKPGNFVGNGPFQLVEHQINSVIAAGKNNHYWDASSVRLEGIRFYPIESVDTEERAYRAGFLHLTQSVSADRIDYLKEKYPEEIYFEPLSRYLFLSI
jgi:oligopeptide transport system substrate-binding protein